MRKMMTKEVTKTTVKIAKMVVVEGTPTIEPMDDVILIGAVSMEKAQKAITKMFEGQGNVTVFGVEPSTEVYEMAVEEFIKLATLKMEEETQTTEN